MGIKTFRCSRIVCSVAKQRLLGHAKVETLLVCQQLANEKTVPLDLNVAEDLGILGDPCSRAT